MMYDIVVRYLKKTKIPFIILDMELIELVKNKQYDVGKVINADLSSSFDQGFAVYYREVLTEEMLLLLHNYFRNTCCNIENIVLITIDTLGLDRYYKNFCSLNKTKGFNIIEIPWIGYSRRFVPINVDSFLPKKQSIKSLFSFYGGTYELNPPERTIMALFASRYSKLAHVETLFTPATWQEVENYLEYLTYFRDVESINKYKDLYNLFTSQQKFNIPKLIKTDNSIQNEWFTRQGPQWEIDSQSFFSLVRETNSTQNFYCITEKTMRCFYHGIAVIPTHGEFVIDDLESIGFKINRSLINYSYLSEDNLFFRLEKLKVELDKLKEISFDDWHSIWLENYDVFKYNSEYLINSYKTNFVIPRLDNYFI